MTDSNVSNDLMYETLQSMLVDIAAMSQDVESMRLDIGSIDKSVRSMRQDLLLMEDRVTAQRLKFAKIVLRHGWICKTPNLTP